VDGFCGFYEVKHHMFRFSAQITSKSKPDNETNNYAIQGTID